MSPALLRTTNVTAAFLAAMFENFNVLFNKGWEGYQSIAEKVCMAVPSKGEQENYAWLGQIPNMKEWASERTIEALAAYAYSLKNVNYEVTVGVDRNNIEDDRLGTYAPLVQELGRSARAHADYLLATAMAAGWTASCYDGKYYFATDHPVESMAGATGTQANSGGGASTAWYLLDLSRAIRPFILQRRKEAEFVAMDQATDEVVFTNRMFRYGVDDRKAVGYGLYQFAWGDKNALNSTYFTTAMETMAAMKDEKGRPIGCKPTHLVVPASLMSDAMTLVNAQNDAAGASNIWYKSVELIVNPYL